MPMAAMRSIIWAAGGVRWVRGNRHRPLRARPEEGKGALAVFWRPSCEHLRAARELPPGTGPPVGPAAPSGSPQASGFDAASIQAGLEALTKTLQPGTPPPMGPQNGINAEIDQIMGGKRP